MAFANRCNRLYRAPYVAQTLDAALLSTELAQRVRASPLYQLFETYYDEVKAVWEERFETKFGFWRGFVEDRGRSLPRLWGRRRGFCKTEMRRHAAVELVAHAQLVLTEGHLPVM